MAEPRVIKRYANRKLYDTQRSRYVTLDQIADMIRSGDDVRIIDNTSKEDLTSITLAQIILEEEKRQKSILPISSLRNIIESGGESIQELASQAGARVRSVFRREGDGDAVDAPAAGDHGGDVDGPSQRLRELFGRSQQTIDEWQRRVDDRVRQVVDALAPWTALQKDLADLQQRVSDLERRQGGRG